MQQIVADALEEIDDERLELVTVTSVEVEPDLRHAVVFYDSLQGEEGDAEVLEALGEARVRLQAAIGRQARVKRTPELAFRPDLAVRGGDRIDSILREIGPLPDDDEPDGAMSDEADPIRRATRHQAGSEVTGADAVRLDGLAVVDKEPGWTSHDVVAKARGILHTRKIGHSGTLDPDATGVLLLGIGRATRLLRFLDDLPKSYTGEVVLGVETSTLDAAGEVVATHDMAAVTLDDARGRVGRPDRRHPAGPADGVGGEGRRATTARAGPPGDRGRARRPDRSRSTASTLAELPGAPGVLRDRRRVLVGHLRAHAGRRPRPRARRWRPPPQPAPHRHRIVHGGRRRTPSTTWSCCRWPRSCATSRPCQVDDELAAAVGHGKVLERSDFGIDADAAEGRWAVFGPDGALLAVYEAHRGTTVKPAVVVAEQGDG